MVATFVRPADADLAAMSKRANSPLSPEGAEAWYRTDIAWLLQEVVYLRSAIAETRQWLGQGDNGSLIEAAQSWQEHSTGIWEKQQVQKIKAALAEARSHTTDLQSELELRVLDLAREKTAHDEAKQSLAQALQDKLTFKEECRKEMGLLITRLNGMDDALDSARRELQEERRAGERNSQMTEALIGQKTGQVRELLEKAIELL